MNSILVSVQESSDGMEMSPPSRMPNESQLWPLTTVNNSRECTLDDGVWNVDDVERTSDKKQRQKTMHPDSNSLVDRYHLAQRVNRDNVDTRQYSSDEDDGPQSPFSPGRLWKEQGEEEDEEDI
jgi:hypothetical protein